MAEIEIEAFRAGTPASKGITAAQIAEAASSFNPAAQRAPVVMGHPGNDQEAPAFGVLSGARVEGSSLFVKIKDLAKEAVDGVRQSRILNRSMAFWHPDHPSNPTPGKLSLRHLGLLGGALPAIPGLPPLRFSADDAEADGGHLIADGAPGEAVIFSAPPAAELPAALDLAGIATAVAAILNPAPEPKKEFAVATQAELDAREAQLAQREADAAQRETEFAAAAKATREAANTSFAAQLVTAGKFPTGKSGDLVAILNAMPVEPLTFSDGAKSPADALKALLDSATPVIQFSTITPTGQPQFAAPGGDNAEATALAAAQARTANAWQGK